MKKPAKRRSNFRLKKKKQASTVSRQESQATSGSVAKGYVAPMRPVPEHIACPPYGTNKGVEKNCNNFSQLAPDELDLMRETCQAARRILKKAVEAVQPGVTTDQIDALVHDACLEEGGYPSPRNYHGFPKSVCTSVNEVICHGIPDDRPLQEGDVVNIDVTLYRNGLHGDCSETVAVGNIDKDSENLLKVARECMDLGISAARANERISRIGCSIETHAHRHGYSVVQDFCGHGVGKCFHMPPQVPHYCDRNFRTILEPGMVLTVEPMINMGTLRSRRWEDGWTAITADLERSAQFERTILITEGEPEILTV